MSDNKRYYWLKIGPSFHDSHTIRILEGSLQNELRGYALALFYERLCAHSVYHEGVLRFSDDVAYTVSDLAKLTRMPNDIAASGFKILKKLKLLVVEADGSLFFPEVLELFESKSDSAERMRKHRARQKESSKTGLNEQNPPENENKKASQSDKNVTHVTSPCDADVTNLLSPPTTPSIDTRYKILDIKITDTKSLATSSKESVSKEKDKENNNHTIIKEIGPEAGPVVVVVSDSESSVPDLSPIDKFWNAYPRKEGRGDVEKWFKENQPSEELLTKILSSIERHRTSRKWLKDSRYISTPINWLNGKRWEDKPEQDPEAAQAAYQRKIDLALAEYVERQQKQKELEEEPPVDNGEDAITKALNSLEVKRVTEPISDPFEQLRMELLGDGLVTDIFENKLFVQARGYQISLAIDKVKQKLEKQGVQFTARAIRRKFDESIH